MIQENMNSSSYADILQRIEAALDAARAVFARFTPGAIETEYKIGHDPVTLPPRVHNPDYHRGPIPPEMYVPDRY